MAKSRRFTAVIMAVVAVAVILSSLVFIIEHAEHDCVGDGCEICRAILSCSRAFGALCQAIVAVYALAAAVRRLRLARAGEKLRFAHKTPVALRVKLSN